MNTASLNPMQLVSGDQRKQGACSLQWIEGFKEGMAVDVLVFNLQNHWGTREPLWVEEEASTMPIKQEGLGLACKSQGKH